LVKKDTIQSGRNLTYLELTGINKNFGDIEVLRNFDLAVRKGEICCLLGPSGCGKTTALRIIDGLLPADGGTVCLDGVDITLRTPQQRGLGMVFQNYALFPHLNVVDNIAYGLVRRKVPAGDIAPKVAEVLRLVRLEGYEQRQISELSGGQQQRIALARALVITPNLLLLDEPLSNLDARLRADMREEIKHIQRTLDITTIYVTHDQEEAISIADRIAVMNRGVIEQLGDPSEIYDAPASRFVADFIGSVNMLPVETAGASVKVLGRIVDLSPELTNRTGLKTAAIRPERLTISSVDSGIKATVLSATYLGATTRYRLAVEAVGVEEIIVDIGSASPPYVAGDRVNIDFRDEDLRLFYD
jgi:putative spermidine/putrescine transport system ATP-binding protein